MLTNSQVFSGFSVNELDKAMDFYKNTLGLEVSKEEMGVLALHIKGNNNNIRPLS
jgi:catechol-2,3-dioxygenase